MIDALSCPTYYYSRPEYVDNGNCIRFKEFTGVYLGRYIAFESSDLIDSQ